MPTTSPHFSGGSVTLVTVGDCSSVGFLAATFTILEEYEFDFEQLALLKSKQLSHHAELQLRLPPWLD